MDTLTLNKFDMLRREEDEYARKIVAICEKIVEAARKPGVSPRIRDIVTNMVCGVYERI